jgi:CRISPR-associated protein Cas2
MAGRIRYLVLYDIRDARRLRRVHDVAVDYGEMLQYSVYVCDLSRQEYVRFRAAIRKEMNLNVDSLSVFDLGPADGGAARRVEHLGRVPSGRSIPVRTTASSGDPRAVAPCRGDRSRSRIQIPAIRPERGGGGCRHLRPRPCRKPTAREGRGIEWNYR